MWLFARRIQRINIVERYRNRLNHCRNWPPAMNESGHIGDYVAWVITGVAIVGVVSSFTLR